jgi:acetyltransferase-like isoleucine patch superfamily enzyme
MLRNLYFFWKSDLFYKLHVLSTLYYRAKGAVLYRFVFHQFGTGSHIRKPLLIFNPKFISIGNRVAIRDGIRLEVVPSKNQRIPQLIIEDDTNIEQNVHIVCHNRVHIRSKVSITCNCSIVDVTHPFSDVYDPQKIGSRIQDDDSFVEIGEGSFIGIGTVILPNVKIGKFVVIGANSVVDCDIPDYSVAAGVPAVVLRRYDFTKDEWVRTSLITAARTLDLIP